MAILFDGADTKLGTARASEGGRKLSTIGVSVNPPQSSAPVSQEFWSISS